MKRISVIVALAFIILFAGQTAFAKVDMTLDIGYTQIVETTKRTGGIGEFPSGTIEGTEKNDGFKLGLSLAYDFTRDFSLAGSFSAKLFKESAEFDKNIYAASLFAQYNVVRVLNNSVGLQAGVMDSFSSGENSKNYFFIALGAYADLNPVLGLNIYLDAKVPIVTLFEGKGNDFKVFFYDVKAGLKYSITPNVYFGIEGTIDNCNYNGAKNIVKSGGIEDLYYEYKVTAYDYSIGANLGYKF